VGKAWSGKETPGGDRQESDGEGDTGKGGREGGQHTFPHS
jgi:hypothetical protein